MNSSPASITHHEVLDSPAFEVHADQPDLHEEVATKQPDVIGQLKPSKEIMHNEQVVETIQSSPIVASPEKHRKLTRIVGSPGSENKVVNVINSTKIVIKALNVNPVATLVAASPPKESIPPIEAAPSHDESLAKKVENTEVSDESSMLVDMAADERNALDNTVDTSAIEEPEQQHTSTPKMKREFMQLQRTVTESKMLTEFMNDSESRSRKAKRAYTHRLAADDVSDNDSVVSSRTSMTIDRSRSRSRSMNYSPSSGKTTNSHTPDGGKIPRRNMRSQNAEFSAKQQKFLMGIQQQQQEDSDASENSDRIQHVEVGIEMDGEANEEKNVPPRIGSDIFCWHCHKSRTSVACTTCKRSFHTYCLRLKASKMTEEAVSVWRCAECLNEPGDGKKKPKYSRDELTTMLKFALKRCQLEITNKNIIFPSNPEIIVNEMSLSILDSKINSKQYTTTAAFTSDMKWIMHNCSVSGDCTTKKLTAIRNMLRTAKQEMYDIETCPECYYNANTRRNNWFEEVCMRPHILLWAKMKGFPFWPAKAMGVNSGSHAGTLVDVRFFGEHDRSWVPVRDCFLFSKEDPNPPGYKYKRNNILDSLKEVDVYIKKITLKFGSFTYAPRKHTYNPEAEDEQLEMLIPNIRPYLAQRSTIQRPDLTFKIVKTADNNMSMVKKSDSPVASSVKSLIPYSYATTALDNNGQHNITKSESPQKDSKESITPEQQNIQQIIAKNGNMNPRLIINKDPLLHSYQILPSANHNTSKPDDSRQDGKVKAVILKRKSQTVQQPANEKKKTRLETSKQLENGDTNEMKQDTTTVNDKSIVTEATSSGVVDAHNVTSSESETLKPEETNLNTSCLTKTANSSSELSHDNEISLSAIRVSNRSSAEVSANMPDPLAIAHPDERHLFIPMMEVKQEAHEEEEPFTLSSSQSSLNTTSEMTKLQYIEVKPEPISDEELDGDDITTETPVTSVKSVPPTTNKVNALVTKPVTPPVPAIQRGNITVKDMSKLKNPVVISKVVKQQQQQCAQPKASFKSAKAKDTKTIKTNLPPCITITSKNQNFNSMVYIPMNDGKHFSNESLLSLPKDSSTTTTGRTIISIPAKSHPPPLTSVGHAPVSMHNNHSIVVNSQSPTIQQPRSTPQPIISTPSNVNYNTTSTSCPPPLSLVAPILNTSIAAATSSPQSQQSGGVGVNHHPNNNANSPTRHFLGDMIPDNLARAVTDTLARGTPPRLAAKPTGALRSDGVGLSTTVDAGPVSQLLIQNSHKLADFFRSVMEDTLADLSGISANSVGNSLEARLRLLQLENERLRTEHASEILKLRTNTDQILCEMQKSLENEKTRIIAETRRQCEVERIRCVEETKKKQWCVQCGKEAQFYCCWNTSYCDYPCQQHHWIKHMPKCAQQNEHNTGLKYANVAVQKSGPTAATTKTANYKVANANVKANNKQKQFLANHNTAPSRVTQQQRITQHINTNPVQHSPTSFTLHNRPVNCIVVSAAPSPTTHIPNQIHTYSATTGGNSLLLTSSSAAAVQPTQKETMLRIVSTASLSNK